MNVFIDTSALYALLDRSDAHHKKAGSAWTHALEKDDTLVTSHYVLVESFALIQSRLGMDAVRVFQEDVLPVINVRFVDAETHRSAVSALLSAARRHLSLVDCVSFEMMRSLGIRAAFTFDPHFKEQRFTTVP